MKKVIEISNILKQNDPILKHLFAAVQKQIDLLDGIIEEIKLQSKDTENLSGWYFHKVAKNIANIERRYNESDTTLKTRLVSLTQRKQVPKWNTAKAGRAYLSYYFPTADIYSTIPCIAENKIQNGNFVQTVGWTINRGVLTDKNAFISDRSLGLEAGSSAKQSVNLNAGSYALRFAHHGAEVQAQVKTVSEYWNPNLIIGDTLGGWTQTQYIYKFESTNNWVYRTIFFTLPKNDNVEIFLDIAGGIELPIKNVHENPQALNEFRTTFLDNSFRDGAGGGLLTGGINVITKLDHFMLGVYPSPSIEYIVKLTGKAIDRELDKVKNLYDSGDKTTASYIDNTFREGNVQNLTTDSQIKVWEKLIGASGVKTKITIIS